MSSLLAVLHDAAGRGATEIVLEPDAPPNFGASGPAEGPALGERELFDALAGVLAPEQQAELAVGNLVEFQVDDGPIRWNLVAEARGAGMVVRGRTAGAGGVEEKGAPMELPPLARERMEAVADAPPSPGPLLRKARDTAWDLSAQEAPVAPGAPAAPTLTGLPTQHVAAEPDLDFAFVAPSPDSAGPTGSEPTGGEPIGSDRTGAKPRAVDELAPASHRRAGDQAVSRSAAGTAPTLAAFMPPSADERLTLAPGTIAWVQGVGRAERLVAQLDEPHIVRSPDDVVRLARRPGGERWVVIAMEDPSLVLGWVLRQAEEGARVLIETAARSLAGAKRILLGVHAGPTASPWLDALDTCWLAEGDGHEEAAS